MSNQDPYRAGYDGANYRPSSSFDHFQWEEGKHQAERDRKALIDAFTQDNSPTFWDSGSKGTSGNSSTLWGGGSGGNASSKVICTELLRQGLFSSDDHRLCFDDAKSRLTDAHFRGYYAWALFVVRRMRRSPRWTRFFHILAQARVNQIAARRGEPERANFLGKIVIALGEPACAVLGRFTGARDYRSLYSITKPASE